MIRFSFKTLFQIHKSHFNLLPTSLSNRLYNTCSSLQRLVDTYGLPSNSAIFISDKLKITNPKDDIERPDKEKLIQNCFNVFGVLKDYGFSGTQIAKLIQKHPRTLRIRSQEALQARFGFFEQNGIKRKDLGEFIVRNPSVLSRGVETRLSPAWEFLRTCVGSDDKVMLVLARWPWLLTCNLNSIVQPNVVLLMDNGVPLAAISKLILSHPRTFMQRPEKMSRVIMELKESGRDPGSKMFLWALKVMVNISEVAWRRKMEALRSFGLTEGDIKFMVKTYPLWLACSEKKIRAAFDFLVNTMKLDLRSIIERPMIIMYSVEGWVRPRLNVLKVLKSKNLVSENVKLDYAMTLSETRFLTKFVVQNQELVPDLMDVYRSSFLT